MNSPRKMEQKRLFWVITDEDWARSFKWARQQTNTIADQIKMKLHPQNETPGTHVPAALPKPVELREVVDLIDLLAYLVPVNHPDYYSDAFRKRLKDIKSRL